MGTKFLRAHGTTYARVEFSGPLISPKCTLFYGLHWNAFKRPNKWALGTWAVSSALFTTNQIQNYESSWMQCKVSYAVYQIAAHWSKIIRKWNLICNSILVKCIFSAFHSKKFVKNLFYTSAVKLTDVLYLSNCQLAPGQNNNRQPLSYSKLCSSANNSSSPFETHLSSHIFIVGTFVGGAQFWGNSSPPTYKRNEDRQWPLRGQNWWYYLKEGYYKNISWKDISWKVISAFFNLGKKWWMTARLPAPWSFDQNEWLNLKVRTAWSI